MAGFQKRANCRRCIAKMQVPMVTRVPRESWVGKDGFFVENILKVPSVIKKIPATKAVQSIRL